MSILRGTQAAPAWYGQVAEWLKAHAWNACIRATVSRVRIPLCPPFFFHVIVAEHLDPVCSNRVPSSARPHVSWRPAWAMAQPGDLVDISSDRTDIAARKALFEQLTSTRNAPPTRKHIGRQNGRRSSTLRGRNRRPRCNSGEIQPHRCREGKTFERCMSPSCFIANAIRKSGVLTCLKQSGGGPPPPLCDLSQAVRQQVAGLARQSSQRPNPLSGPALP